MKYPLTTRTDLEVTGGVAQALAGLHPFAPPAVVIEACRGPVRIEALVAAAKRAGCPVLGVIGPLVETPGGVPAAGIEATGRDRREEAVQALLRTLPVVARLKAARLIVPIGSVPGPATEAALAALRTAPPSERASRLATIRVATRRSREDLAVEVCRALDRITRAASGLSIALLPGPDPMSLGDAESLGWILEDLKSRNVSLVADTGALGLRAALGDTDLPTWFGTFGRTTDLVLISDHDGESRADVLAGLGRLELRGLDGALARATPRVLRPDPTLPTRLLLDAERWLAGRLDGASVD